MKKVIVLILGLVILSVVILSGGAMASKKMGDVFTTNNIKIVNKTLTTANSFESIVLTNDVYDIDFYARGQDIKFYVKAVTSEAYRTIPAEHTFYPQFPLLLAKGTAFYFQASTVPCTIESYQSIY